MPLELLRPLARPLDGQLSPTECSEDSVDEIRPAPFKPTPVAAAATKRSSAFRSLPDERAKRMRLDGHQPPAGYLPLFRHHEHPFLVPPIDDRWMAPWRTAYPVAPPVPPPFSWALLHPPALQQHHRHAAMAPLPFFLHHAPTFLHHLTLPEATPEPVVGSKPIDAPDKRKTCSSSSASSSASSFLSVDTILGNSKTEPKAEPAKREPPKTQSPAQQQEQQEQQQQQQQPANRNYKNMTRERRMQANARERTRVHTISAAFEALRKAVPSFSHGQRLSKLSILRVASAYIGALSQLAHNDADDADARLGECVDLCTRTLMTEGQTLRKKSAPSASRNRDDNDVDVDDEFDDD